MFYFAWVDKTETTFVAATHARVDEDVYGFQMTHNEGDFPALDVDVLNPKIGLLAPTRKQWVWLSYERFSDGAITPLFFGRLVGVPQSLADTVVRLSFVARPPDYDTQKATVANSMRVAPFYDEVFLSANDRNDPDVVLEGYPMLWHIDRTTLAVTASDIITGEDGTVDLTSNAFYDSLSASYSESPATTCTVTATAKWAQAGTGGIDITQKLLQTFASGSATATIVNVRGDPQVRDGMLNIVAGDDMINNWPKPGTTIGGGWAVGASSATLIGNPPLPPVLVGSLDGPYNIVHSWDSWPLLSDAMRLALRIIFERSPGFVVQVIDHNDIYSGGFPYGPIVLGHDKIEVLWIPVWRIAPHMEITFDVSRSRTEVMTFSVAADVQPLLADPGDSDAISINVSAADVDSYIGSVARPRYFSTDRGVQSMEYLVMRARAALLARARAVEVSVEVDFDTAAALSCRKSASLTDDRLPGGIVAGKVKSYSFSAADGKNSGSVVIGCSVGRDGTVTAVPGTPVYVDAGYVDDGYEIMDGAVIVPTDDASIGITLDLNYAIDDDGVNLDHMTVSDWLDHIDYTGTLDSHQEQLNVFTGAPAGRVETIDRASDFATQVSVYMKPITQRAFNSTVTPTLTTLKVPRTINLEAT